MLIMSFGFGLLFLVLGAEALVKGASRLAGAAGISSLVIGLTVVAFGTSAPEMAVGVISAWEGQYDLAIGNVVGSNIFNTLFILGISALIVPLAVSQQLIRLDVPLMIVFSLAIVPLCWDGLIQRWEAALLFSTLLAYTIFLISQSRKETAAAADGSDAQEPATMRFAAVNGAFIIGGLGFLVLGSQWLVHAAVAFAQNFGISERVIGLTIVAAGTSLPELATSAMASIRGERDIAVGNVVGSNIFNLLGVLGLSGMAAGVGLSISPSTLAFDIPVMIAAAVVCLPLFFTGFRISRGEGAFFLVAYSAYMVVLIR